VTPANRADSRDESDPIRGENEDKDRREEPERPVHERRAENALKKSVESFNRPLEQVLRARGHLPHVARCDLRKSDERERHDPRDHHRVGDRNPERVREVQRLLR
jgi:hypothetical protein